MSKITVARTGIELPTEPVLAGVRQFLFKCFAGANDEEDRAWRRFWARIVRMEAGEISFLDFIIPRNGKFHRKFFALLDFAYDTWEPPRKRKTYRRREVEKSREQFREDIIILAGFYVQTFDLRGRMRMRAKSISFANMDDVEFERVYQSVLTVLLREVLTNYKNRDEVDAVVDRLIGFA